MKIKYTVKLKNGTVYHAGVVEHVGTFIVLREIRENWHQELRFPALDVAQIYLPLVPEHVTDVDSPTLINMVLVIVLVVLLGALIWG